jgi:phage-related protein
MPDYPQVDPNPETYDYWGNPAWMVLSPNDDWTVSNATTGDDTAPLLRAQYGDGYAQVARDGLNQVAQTIKIDVSPINKALAQDIYAFLTAQMIYGKPFLWTPPAPAPQVQVLWTCEKRSWKRFGGTIVGVTADLTYLARP